MLSSITITSGEVGILSGAVAVLVAIVSWATARSVARRQQQLDVYGRATKAVSEWVEMLYRVRRRDLGSFDALDARFHKLQEKINYYQAWISSDSPHMRERYGVLVSGVKGQLEPLIRQAWSEPVRAVPRNALPTDKHPDVGALFDEFTLAVHRHLSVNPISRVRCALVGKPTVPAPSLLSWFVRL